MNGRVWLERREKWLLVALCIAAFAVRAAFAFVTPVGEWPDEQAHLRYVEHLAHHRTLPVQPTFVFEEVVEQWEESYQPPLAYLLYVPTYQMVVDSNTIHPAFLLRLQNALYGALTVVVGYLAIAFLTPAADPRRLFTGIMLAAVPGFAGNTAAVNNDGLANLLAAALWLPLLCSLRPVPRAVLSGAAFATAAYAKLSVMPLAPMLLFAPLLVHRRSVREAFRDASLSATVAVSIGLPWMLRNVSLYGHPLALDAGGTISITWAREYWVRESGSTGAMGLIASPMRSFQEFWGVFGVQNQLLWEVLSIVLTTLAAFGLVGWIVAAKSRQLDRFECVSSVFAAAVTFSAGSVVWASMTYVGAAQGRYLYPVALPIVALIACGWARLVPEGAARPAVLALAILLAALDLGVLAKLAAFYSASGGQW